LIFIESALCIAQIAINKLNDHRLKDGGFKLSAESTDTGRQTRQFRLIPDRRIRIAADRKMCMRLLLSVRRGTDFPYF
jgi:hypothetical protein